MEEEPDASESDANRSASFLEPSPVRSAPTCPSTSGRASIPTAPRRVRPLASPAVLRSPVPVLLILAALMAPSSVRADALERVRQSGRLVYGSDMEGGGPYAYPDPDVAAAG